MLRLSSAFNFKLEAPTVDSTAHVRENPSVWIDLLKTASYAAWDYLEKWDDKEVASFMTQPKVLEAVVQYLVEFDLEIMFNPNKDHRAKMLPRCNKYGDYLSSYNITSPMFTKTDIKKSSIYEFIFYYDKEVKRAKAIAKKLQQVLNTQSAEGALDPIFKRTISAGLGVGTPRPISVGLFTSKQYTLMQAIYKHLSTGILIPELIIGNTGSVFASLVNTLPHEDVHPLLSALIKQISADQATLLKWTSSIPQATLTKLENVSPSIYAKWVKATTPPSTAGTHVALNLNEIELGSMSPYDTTNANNELEEKSTEVLFGDNMPLPEVTLGNINGSIIYPVIYESVKNDVFENPEKLLKIAEIDATLAHIYLNQIFIDRNDKYMEIINSKSLRGKFVTMLINKIPGSHILYMMIKDLDSESLKTLFINSTEDQWGLFPTLTHASLLKAVTKLNAIELLEKLPYNLLTILIEQFDFLSAQNLYMTASDFYVNTENGNTSTASLTDWINARLTLYPNIKDRYALFDKGIAPSVMTFLFINAYRKDDNSFVEFCNKNYFSMANYLYLFEGDDQYNSMRERVFLSLNATSWYMLAKADLDHLFNRVSYLMSAIPTENPETVLNKLKVDLLGILASGHSKTQARQLYMKYPSCLDKIVNEATKTAFLKDIFEYLLLTNYPSKDSTRDNEYKLLVQRLKMRDSPGIIKCIDNHPALALKLLLCFSDEQMDAFVALDKSLDLFDKVHDTFKNHTPFSFILKAGIVCDDKLILVGSVNKRVEILRRCPDDKASLKMFLSNALAHVITALSTTSNSVLVNAFHCIDAELKKLSEAEITSCLQKMNLISFCVLLEKSPEIAKQLYQTGKSYFDSCENDDIKAAVSRIKSYKTTSERFEAIENSLVNMLNENKGLKREIEQLKRENAALKLENTALKAKAPTTAVSTVVSFQGSNTTAPPATTNPSTGSYKWFEG